MREGINYDEFDPVLGDPDYIEQLAAESEARVAAIHRAWAKANEQEQYEFMSDIGLVGELKGPVGPQALSGNAERAAGFAAAVTMYYDTGKERDEAHETTTEAVPED